MYKAPAPPPSPEALSKKDPQFRVMIAMDRWLALEKVAKASGFLTANALAASILTEFSKLPEGHVFALLANVEDYPRRLKKHGRFSR
jgi:hypothetical protein